MLGTKIVREGARVAPRQSPDFRLSFSELQVLVVEADSAMRSMLYYMLRDLGVSHVKMHSLSRSVLERMADSRFDIVVLGHGSQSATTGVQLLEEARYRGLIKPTVGWVFVTADNTQELILHAIDSRPDVLITAPLTQAVLQRRLQQLLQRKLELREIDESLEADDPDGVLIACDRVSRSSRYLGQVQEIKARVLLDLNQPDEARDILEQRYWQAQEKEIGALLVEARIALEQYESAEQLAAQLVEQYPLFMRGYDLHARVQELLGDMPAACETLEQATRLSPLGIPRQMELGRVAIQNNALELAKGAYRRSISLGKHSCYRAATPYLKLANIACLQLKSAEKKQKGALQSSVEQLLKEAEEGFHNDPQLRVRTALMRSNMFAAIGDADAAERCLHDAEERNRQLDLPLDLEAERNLADEDKTPLLKPEKVESRPVADQDQSDPEMSAKVTRLGIKHYLAGKSSQAIRYFSLAQEYDPGNTAALLNLAQLFMESARDDEANRSERYKMVDRYLHLLDKIKLSGLQRKRLAELHYLRELTTERLPQGSLGVLLQ